MNEPKHRVDDVLPRDPATAAYSHYKLNLHSRMFSHLFRAFSFFLRTVAQSTDGTSIEDDGKEYANLVGAMERLGITAEQRSVNL